MLVGLAMDAQTMTQLYAREHHMIRLLLDAGWLAIGALIGAFHYLALRWNTRALIAGQSVPLAVAMQLARLAGIACILAIITRNYGALPLLIATLGILASRAAVLRLGVGP
jgi:F1F0 ATPase subunit 2